MAWGIRRSHSRKGKLGLQDAKPAKKWFLKVWIARSAALRLWMWGGTSWKEMSLFFSAFLKSFEISLSRMYFSG